MPRPSGNLKRLEHGRMSFSPSIEDRQFLEKWAAEREAANGGVHVGISGALRAAVQALRGGTTESSGFSAGHDQGVRAAFSHQKAQLAGAFAGLASAPPAPDEEHEGE